MELLPTSRPGETVRIAPTLAALDTTQRMLAADAVWCLGAGAVAVTFAKPLARQLKTRAWVIQAVGGATVAWGGVIGTAAMMDDFIVETVAKAALNVNGVAAVALISRPLTEQGGTITGRFIQAAAAVQVAGFARGLRRRLNA